MRFFDDFVSEPIKLQNLEDKDGQDGISANLEEGDQCMAPWKKKLYAAKILRILSGYTLTRLT